MKILLFILSIILVGTMATEYIFAQTYTGVLILDPIPSQVKTGETITFSGILKTTSGEIVQFATITIKDDVDFGSDDVIGTLQTDENGEFVGTLTAQPRSSGAWDFYATYQGSGDISSARSQTHSVTVSDYASSNSNYANPSSSSKVQTNIILDNIPSLIYAGDSVIFTGTVLANGQPLQNAHVSIKEDDPLSPDDTLSTGVTDSNGKFKITWNVSAGIVETDFDIYAIFEGANSYEKSRSINQIMSVLKHSGSIRLDSIPSSAKIGQPITFSGTLSLEGINPEGAIVYIKDEDMLNPDDLIATAYVNSNGKFSATWFASEMDPDDTVDIFAVFEGDDVFERLTTCDSMCTNTIPLRISGEYSPPSNPTISPPTTTPVSPPKGSLPVSPTQVDINGEYVKFIYSLDFSKNPHVTIVPNPDSYDEAKKYVISAQEGILMWKSHLDNNYGGNWNVDFDVVTPGQSRMNVKPDVILNLVTPEQESGCNTDYYGISYPSTIRPIQTSVCVSSNGKATSHEQVSATSAHEFIHAMGLGHVWNKQGDMMCSAEIIGGKKVFTCPNYNLGKSKTPSELDLAGITKLYGTDGFRNPNTSVTNGQLFAIENPTNFNPPKTPNVSNFLKDSDNDGIADIDDFCENSKETWNGYNDEDGCPDSKPHLTPPIVQPKSTTQTTEKSGITVTGIRPPLESESPPTKSHESDNTSDISAKCGSGTILKDGECVLDVKCGTGTILKDGECVIEEKTTSSENQGITQNNDSKLQDSDNGNFISQFLNVLKSLFGF